MVGDYDNPEIRARPDAALDELFGQIIAWEGAITGEHGIGLAKMRWWDKALSCGESRLAPANQAGRRIRRTC